MENEQAFDPHGIFSGNDWFRRTRTRGGTGAAAVAALLLTGGGGAFAVASFAPDPAELPVRMVNYPVESLAENMVLGQLDAPSFSLFRSEQVRSSDTPESLLQRMGVADPAAAAFMRSDMPVRQHVLGRSGRIVSAETTDDHRLIRLTARWVFDEGAVGGGLRQRSSQRTAQRSGAASLAVVVVADARYSVAHRQCRNRTECRHGWDLADVLEWIVGR